MKNLLLNLKNSQSVRALQLLHSTDSNVDLQFFRFQDNLKVYVEAFQEELQKQRLNKMLPREATSMQVPNQVMGSLYETLFLSPKNFYINFMVIPATSQVHWKFPIESAFFSSL